MDPRDAVTLPESGGEGPAPTRFGHFVLGKRLGAGGMGVVFEAQDTTLARTVALKLLHPGEGAEAHDRLLHEAQALARLSHPNVVTVYEAGVAGDELFIAMELLDGATLKEWIAEPRPWRDVLDIFVAAGRGLAAVHELGLVHRDFKPSNVLIDRAGTPKVGDFGVVCHAGERPEVVAGTPAYMAPEQKHGQPLDGRADQFAFATVLDESLGDDAPGRLRAVLARGRAPDASLRFPSMTALLDQLARVRRGRRREWIAAGGIAGLAGAVALAWSLGHSKDDPCPAPTARMAALWSERADALRAHLVEIDPAQGAARFDAAARVVEPLVADLGTMHVDACRATRVRGAQSDSLLDLRMRCLDRRATELDQALALVEGASDLGTLDEALHGLVRIRHADVCADATALAGEDTTPEDDAIDRRIDAIEVERRADRLTDLPDRARAIVADARVLAHPRPLASALSTLASVQSDVGDTAAATETWREVTQIAASAHDDQREATAWLALIGLIGYEEGQPQQGLDLVPAASAAVLRAGSPIDLSAKLLYVQAIVLDGGTRAAEGLADLTQERRMLVEAGAERDGTPLAITLADALFESANALVTLDRTDEAIDTFHLAIDRYRAIYGPDSLDEAMTDHDLGEALHDDGRNDEALVVLQEAARIHEARSGASPMLAGDLVSIGTAQAAVDHWQDALASYDRALALYRGHVADDDPAVIPVLTGRASALDGVGRKDEALAAYAELIALIQKSGTVTLNLPIALFNRGQLAETLGRNDEALADYRLSIGEFESQRGKDCADLAYPLVGAGRVLVTTRHAAEAVPLLQRAIALPSRGGDALQQAFAHAWLGRALAAAPATRAKGIAIARAARHAMVDAARSDPDAADALAELDKWLTSGSRRSP